MHIVTYVFFMSSRNEKAFERSNSFEQNQLFDVINTTTHIICNTKEDDSIFTNIMKHVPIKYTSYR